MMKNTLVWACVEDIDGRPHMVNPEYVSCMSCLTEDRKEKEDEEIFWKVFIVEKGAIYLNEKEVNSFFNQLKKMVE